MCEIFVIGWFLIVIICEVYLAKSVVDSNGETSWPDDDSKALATQHAKYKNDDNDRKRRLIRFIYIVLLVLLILFALISTCMPD